MPSIGLSEMLMIAVAVLIFIRPDDLPKFFRIIGNFYGQSQRYYYRMKAYSRQTFDEISRLDQPPPKPWQPPEYDAGHDTTHDDHYHDEHYHDEHYHDQQHHEYESAYAVADLADNAGDVIAKETGAANANPAETASPAPTALKPEAADEIVGRHTPPPEAG